MATVNDSGKITMTAGGTIARCALVVESSGSVVACGAGGRAIGVVAHDGDASYASADTDVPVILFNKSGTFKVTAAGAFSAGALLYAAASGKVDDVAVGRPQFVAREAATADGDIVQAVWIPSATDGGARTVEAHTADDTLTNSESGSIHTSVGAAGTVVLSLPAAIVGIEYYFAVGAAQELRIDPNGSETISLPSTGVPGAAGKYLTANAIGETVHLVCCSAGSWRAFGFTGTWTAEA